VKIKNVKKRKKRDKNKKRKKRFLHLWFCYALVNIVDRCCSCNPELFVSVHIQRCTVLQLHVQHACRVNSHSTVRLYQR